MKRLILLILTLISWSLPALAEFHLEADISDKKLLAVENGQVIKQWTVAVGTKKYPTPTGSFRIRKVVFNPAWKPPDEKWAKGKSATPPGHPDNPMKVVKIFFKEPDYYIHGTADDDSLGSAASHGCIRMSPDEATQLAQLVMARGGKPMPEPWYQRIFHRRSTKVVYLATAVPIAIHG